MSIALPGFADAVRDAQLSFRAVLEAMSRPGSLCTAGAGMAAPAPLDPATAAVLLTLADNDTPVWLASDCTAARDWISFHCGAAVIPDLHRAAFAVAREMPDLDGLDAGTDEGPEESATLILQVRDFGEGRRLRLVGPGLAAPVTLLVDGIPENFVSAWQASHALYPRGIDMILCAGSTLTALPRSVRITEG